MKFQLQIANAQLQLSDMLEYQPLRLDEIYLYLPLFFQLGLGKVKKSERMSD